jgi:hypothetical protein
LIFLPNGSGHGEHGDGRGAFTITCKIQNDKINRQNNNGNHHLPSFQIHTIKNNDFFQLKKTPLLAQNKVRADIFSGSLAVFSSKSKATISSFSFCF